MYNTTEAEVMQMGMACLIENLGVIDTERFISNLLRERFDYTEWRQKNLADMDLDTLLNEAAEYEKAHPFRGGKKND
jgi:hypothetical protein